MDEYKLRRAADLLTLHPPQRSFVDGKSRIYVLTKSLNRFEGYLLEMDGTYCILRDVLCYGSEDRPGGSVGGPPQSQIIFRKTECRLILNVESRSVLWAVDPRDAVDPALDRSSPHSDSPSAPSQQREAFSLPQQPSTASLDQGAAPPPMIGAHKSAHLPAQPYLPPSPAVADFRSDTVTSPSEGMRRAMARAEVGDDVYGEDPSVKLLQRKMASLFGFESALFVPSGTMGNLIAQLVHGSGAVGGAAEAFVGSVSHIVTSEAGGAASLGGVYHSHLPNRPDGTFPLAPLLRGGHVPHPRHYARDVLSAAGLASGPVGVSTNVHHAITRMVCVEDTHNFCGGAPLPSAFKKDVRAACEELGVPLHCDGARIWNSVVATGRPSSDVGKEYDSISICLSKGLGCPVGSVVLGASTFITNAQHYRKMLGGGMRQAGVLAAAALHQLSGDWEAQFRDDHANASMLAEGIASAPPSSGLRLLTRPYSNIVLFEVTNGHIPLSTVHTLVDVNADPYGVELGRSAAFRIERDADILRTRFLTEMEMKGVKFVPMPIGPKTVMRAVTHCNVDATHVAKAVDAMQSFDASVG